MALSAVVVRKITLCMFYHFRGKIMRADKWVQLTVTVITITKVAFAETDHRVKRAGGVIFPEASGMGIFLALAVPVDLPDYELSVSYNFEANYLLPDNITELELGPQITQVRYARSLTRSRVYNLLEERLHREGWHGKQCLLRLICETSAADITGHNGLLGDIIHLIFTPSSSEPEEMSEEYFVAEKVGQEGREACLQTYRECPFDLYELFSAWEDA